MHGIERLAEQVEHSPIRTTPVSGKDLWDAMRDEYESGRRRWVETTQEMRDEMLEALPPVKYISGGFLMGEPWSTSNTGEQVYAAFVRLCGVYLAKFMTISEANSL